MSAKWQGGSAEVNFYPLILKPLATSGTQGENSGRQQALEGPEGHDNYVPAALNLGQIAHVTMHVELTESVKQTQGKRDGVREQLQAVTQEEEVQER